MNGLNIPLGATPEMVGILSQLRADYMRKEVAFTGYRFDGTSHRIRWKAAITVNYVRVHVQDEGDGATYDPDNYVSSTEVDCRRTKIHEAVVPAGHYYVWLVPVEKVQGQAKLLDGVDGRPDAMTFFEVGAPVDASIVSGDLDVDSLSIGGVEVISDARVLKNVTAGADIITSGQFADDRISESSVTQHEGALELGASQITTGTLADARVAESNVTQHEAALELDASQLVSGTLADARVAESNVTQHEGALEIGASQVTSGTLDTARIPNLDASKITTGTLDAARIPNLDASKITSGTFDDARIAASSVTQHQEALELDADQIASGVLPIERGGTGLAALGTAGQVLAVDSGETGLEFVDPPSPWKMETITLAGSTTHHNVAVNADTTVLRIERSGTGNILITGFAGGADGRILVVFASVSSVLLLEENTDSSAENRFQIPAGTTQVGLLAGASAIFVYTGNRWNHIAGGAVS